MKYKVNWDTYWCNDMTLKCSNFKRGLSDFQEFHVTRFHAKFPRNLNLNFT